MQAKHYFLLLLLIFLITSCGSRSPIDRLTRELDQYPEYSVILEDMWEEGNFFKDYYHQYKVIYAEKANTADSLNYQNFITDTYKISKKDFSKYANYLGMVIASKTADGQTAEGAYPPGYQYVGNSEYGRWRTDSSGNSFWEWYGKFAFFGAMFNMFNRPVYQTDWNDYRRYRSRGEPYFGRNQQYGTFGNATKQTNKSFFERQRVREAQRKASFSDRMKQRVKRSNMSNFRSRSSSRGGK